MTDFWATLAIKALGLVLGFALTAIAGYFTKHHVKVKVQGQDVDITQTINDIIASTAKWGISSAETNHNWDGQAKEQYVENLVVDYLQKLPVPVKNADAYRPVIRACIESTLAGSKIAQATQDEDIEAPAATTDNGMPQPEKIDGIEAVSNDKQDTDLSVKGDK